MCGVAKGIVRGLARHFGEQVELTELECMHNGAPSCKLRVTVEGSASHPPVRGR